MIYQKKGQVRVFLMAIWGKTQTTDRDFLLSLKMIAFI